MSPFLEVIIGFTVGNFGWQLLAGRDWMVAVDRSYFQAVAVGYLWFASLYIR